MSFLADQGALRTSSSCASAKLDRCCISHACAAWHHGGKCPGLMPARATPVSILCDRSPMPPTSLHVIAAHPQGSESTCHALVSNP